MVAVHQSVVLTMQNHSSALCHFSTTMRSRKSATLDLLAAMPMIQMPCPIASHMIALEYSAGETAEALRPMPCWMPMVMQAT